VASTGRCRPPQPIDRIQPNDRNPDELIRPAAHQPGSLLYVVPVDALEVRIVPKRKSCVFGHPSATSAREQCESQAYFQCRRTGSSWFHVRRRKVTVVQKGLRLARHERKRPFRSRTASTHRRSGRR